ncbi:MAG TPA: 6-carboxytetrahydropterin synthase [Anaerolineales bacterium]
MYTLAVHRHFIARHALFGGDWGRENLPNAHRYQLELQLEGTDLDQHGFLVDIVAVEKHLGDIVERYRDQFLNDLPEFSGLNPSLEHFARIIADRLREKLTSDRPLSMKVVLWEDDVAWAAYSSGV